MSGADSDEPEQRLEDLLFDAMMENSNLVKVQVMAGNEHLLRKHLAKLKEYIAAQISDKDYKAAYMRGWNDREGDLLNSVDRIYGRSKSKLRVMFETNPGPDPFAICPVRELARRTGQDASNLSKYRLGKIPLSQKLYEQLLAEANAYYAALPERNYNYE